MYIDSDRYPIYAYCVPEIKSERDRVVVHPNPDLLSRKVGGWVGGWVSG